MPATSEQIERVNRLKNMLPKLAERDAKFAGSLLSQFEKKGALSQAQWPWVDKLMEKAEPPALPEPTMYGLQAIVEMFDNAREKGLEKPKIRLDGLVLSGYPKLIYVATDADDYDSRFTYGTIDREGAYTPMKSAEQPKWLMDSLAELATNPMETAVAYGRRTGNCCLCGRTLTNHASIDAGIGPICASKWF